ncbi:TetR/AcrR family transcriptional regulator [Streptomyces sp. NPDC017993]|uniref:TetR/AcrR family transcriptional regulator n=1 Tax=Streptomyces sp. NPDC017993 TaxID=3365027 RepID=UPI00378C56A0
MATRKYEQRLRAESAQATRRRIMDAVCEQLRAAPAKPVSIDRIAQVARVARPTVYQVFGSRAGLFDAVGADLLQRGGFESMIEIADHPDARQGLRGCIRGVVEMYAAHRDVLRALHSMALLDAAAVGGAVQRLEQDRAAGMGHLADRLAEQGLLRQDATAEQAADVLWLLTGFDSFDLLYAGRNAPVEQVADTLVTTAERTLCA